MAQGMCGGHRWLVELVFSFQFAWVPGTELRPTGLTSPRVISLSFNQIFNSHYRQFHFHLAFSNICSSSGHNKIQILCTLDWKYRNLLSVVTE